MCFHVRKLENICHIVGPCGITYSSRIRVSQFSVPPVSSMFNRLFSKRAKTRAAPLENDWDDEEDFDPTVGARSSRDRRGRSRDNGGSYDWQQANDGKLTNPYIHASDEKVRCICRLSSPGHA